MSCKKTKNKKINIAVNPRDLQLILKSAEKRIMYMVEHDMMITGGKCVDTEDLLSALKSFKKDISNAKKA